MSGTVPSPSFEEALTRLEAIVNELDTGELTLEESLRCFEEGIGLQRRCIALLNAAQQRIEVLVEEQGEEPTAGFTAGGGRRSPANPGSGLFDGMEAG